MRGGPEGAGKGSGAQPNLFTRFRVISPTYLFGFGCAGAALRVYDRERKIISCSKKTLGLALRGAAATMLLQAASVQSHRRPRSLTEQHSAVDCDREGGQRHTDHYLVEKPDLSAS